MFKYGQKKHATVFLELPTRQKCYRGAETSQIICKEDKSSSRTSTSTTSSVTSSKNIITGTNNSTTVAVNIGVCIQTSDDEEAEFFDLRRVRSCEVVDNYRRGSEDSNISFRSFQVYYYFSIARGSTGACFLSPISSD